MDQRLFFGLGVSALFLFGRYVFPTIPKPLAWGGVALGAGVMVVSFVPGIRVGPSVLGIIGLTLLAAAIAWQFHIPTPEKAVPPADMAQPDTEKVAPPVLPAKAEVPEAVANQQQPAKLDPNVLLRERQAVLGQLTNLYILSHDGITPRMMAGMELPNAEFLNEELAKQGANWRVRNVQGATAEIYELPIPPK